MTEKDVAGREKNQIAPGKLQRSERIGQDVQDRWPSKAETAQESFVYLTTNNGHIARLRKCYRHTDDGCKYKQDQIFFNRNRRYYPVPNYSNR